MYVSHMVRNGAKVINIYEITKEPRGETWGLLNPSDWTSVQCVIHEGIKPTIAGNLPRHGQIDNAVVKMVPVQYFNVSANPIRILCPDLASELGL